MRYPFAYFTSLWMVALLILGAALGGIGFFTLPLLAFGVVPIADRWLGKSRWPSDIALQGLTPGKERAYDAALVAASAAVLLALGWGLWVAASWALSTAEFIGLTISVGIVTGYVGIVVGHELIHRSTAWERGIGWVLFSAVLYPHFCVEHILGHHPRFATPADHATARRGENLYAFIPRSIVRGLISGIRFRPVRVLSIYALLALLLIAIYRSLGSDALIFMVAQAFVAVCLLESINYVEHYGLLRKRLANGQYEAPGPGHSWDTSSIITNINTFNLGRHSAHHSAARRPYHRLQQNDKAPQLPYGYAAMFLISLVPPLWFRIMDRRLDAWYARQQGDRDASPIGEAIAAPS
jgi:alkane 1-monooxygenase